MERRSFLQALVAAAAGLSAAKAVASAPVVKTLPAPKKTTTPCTAVTADTTKFEESLHDAKRVVADYLKQCRAISYSAITGIDGSPQRWSITYRHAPDAPLTAMDEYAATVTAGRAPIGVVVTASPVDGHFVDHPEAAYQSFGIEEYQIEVEWM